MKLTNLIFLLILISASLVAQPRLNQKEMVVWATEINLREEGSINSKSLMRIMNGEIVQPIYQEDVVQNCELVNDVWGCWIKVNYKNTIGYVFSTYIGPLYQLFYEGAVIEYYPKVKFWYGIYYDHKIGKEIIKKIKTKVVKTLHDGENTEHQILKTDQDSASLFLIATNSDMPEKEMGLFTKYIKQQGSEYTNICPGDNRDLFFKIINTNFVSGIRYSLFATGTYSIDNSCLSLTNYQIYLGDPDLQGNSFKRIQDLGQYLMRLGINQILFAGDIDNDGKPDLILRDCGNACIDILFLSSLASDEELVRPVSYWYWSDDC